MIKNPFVTAGYAGPEYFCDRVEETKHLTQLLVNGNDVVLMSPRRIGKTGLLRHCFNQEVLRSSYNTFLIDIYSTRSLTELVETMGKSILAQLMPLGDKALAGFTRIVSSLRPTMTVDPFGIPLWSVDINRDVRPEFTLDQIFSYLSSSDRHNIIAIDEFQQIANYPEKNVEAVLRTHIQHCRNATWVFSGSSRHMLAEMFSSPSRPFYASTSMMTLESLPEEKYADFAVHLFESGGKHIEVEVPGEVHRRFEGVTWFMQKVMNRLYSMTGAGDICSLSMVDLAIDDIVEENGAIYEDLLYQLTARQKELLLAISSEGKVSGVTSGKFIRRHSLTTSTVQTSVKALVDRQIVTSNSGVYEVYDKFLSIWLRKKF